MKITSKELQTNCGKIIASTTRKLNKSVLNEVQPSKVNKTLNQLLSISDIYAKQVKGPDGVLYFHVLPACRKADAYLKAKGFKGIF